MLINQASLQNWNRLSDKDKQDILNEVSAKRGLPPSVIEKDWWMVRTLEVVFNTSIAAHTVFKGGTSLSKAWRLIDRFSEDIDLALDRRHLGFNQTDEQMNPSQVRRLREASFQFLSDTYYSELAKALAQAGFANMRIVIGEVKCKDQDPLILEVYYPVVTEHLAYIQPRVLIEIGSRSLIEPFENRSFSSMMGEQYAGRPFADLPITIPTVIPGRTFLEKIFLLHEEFQQAPDKIRVDRKSRHLYDLEKLMDTEHAVNALADPQLYQTIVAHRRRLTFLRGIDYKNHAPASIDPIPPDAIISEWERDYSVMKESMFHGASLSFADLMKRMHNLKMRVNQLDF